MCVFIFSIKTVRIKEISRLQDPQKYFQLEHGRFFPNLKKEKNYKVARSIQNLSNVHSFRKMNIKG